MGAWRDALGAISVGFKALNNGITVLDNEIQDSLENQRHEQERNKILAKLQNDIQFIKEYKALVNQLKYTGATRTQIAQIIRANMPKSESINIDELLKNEEA